MAASTPRVPSTAAATQPGEVKPTGETTPEAEQAATQERAKDVNPDTTSESPLTEPQAHPDRTYHDAISGRPVDAQGKYLDADGGVDSHVEPHRIVANDWATLQDEADEQAARDRAERADNA